MSYSRYFITFVCEAEGYGTGGKSPSGSCVLESRGKEGKLSVFVQNIKPETIYSVFVLFPDGVRFAGMPAGKLKVDARGKSQSRFIFPSDNILGGRFVLDEFFAVAVITTRASEITVPLCGYRGNAVKWSRGFYDATLKVSKPGFAPPVDRVSTPGFVPPIDRVSTPGFVPPVDRVSTPGFVPPVDRVSTPGFVPPVDRVSTPGFVPPVDRVSEPESVPVFEQISEPESVPAPPVAMDPRLAAGTQRHVREYAPEPLPPVPITPDQTEADQTEIEQPEINQTEIEQSEIEQIKPADSAPTEALEHLGDGMNEDEGEMQGGELPDILDELFEMFPAESPFQKQNRSAKWVKPTSCDCIPAPANAPGLLSEDFVTRAFEKFGHLLVGVTDSGTRRQFILGVPDNYDLALRGIANALGFTQFKPRDDVRVTRGQFGYWLMFISL